MASLPSKTLKGAIVDEGLIQAIVTGEYDERSTCTISALRCACDIENKRDGSRPPPPPKRQRPLFLCFSTRGGVLSSELRPPFQTTSAAGGSSLVPLRGGNRRYYSCITALLKWTTALAETSEGPAEEPSNFFFFFWRVFPTTPVVCSQIPIPGIQWPDSDTGAGTLEHKSTSCQIFDFIPPTVFPQCGFNTFSVHQKNSLWPNCGTWQLAWVRLNDSWVKGVCEANIVLIV